MEFVHYLNFLKYFVMEVFCFVVFLSSLGNVTRFFQSDILFMASFSIIQYFNGDIFYGLLPGSGEFCKAER